jgi:hypothetical protein
VKRLVAFSGRDSCLSRGWNWNSRRAWDMMSRSACNQRERERHKQNDY